MIAVCRKELRSYRISMIGYVFIAFMLAVVSLYFAYQNLNLASPRFELVLQNVQFIFTGICPNPDDACSGRGEKTEKRQVITYIANDSFFFFCR